MKRIKTIKRVFAILFFFSITISYSQLSVPFKVRFQSYVNGDMTVIANNNVNRVDYTNASNIPYYNHTKNAKLNDEFQMEYIDIDNDNNTFSSSSANLSLENQKSKKIIYAGLYWSSTYKYNSGYMKKEAVFVADDKTRESFDQIKIKFPNQDNYIDLKGEIIFDGINQKGFKDCAPYAVYADVTKEIQNLENPFGEYTVANIKATQGEISGGVASGWTLFFVYEDETMKGKFITSFDGFAGVTDKSTDILFDGFETLPEGNINAKIATASLEGDNNLLGDQILFRTKPENEFIALNNKLRNENNFFNSSITINDNYFTNRKPDSKNTLGYDTSITTIPNLNNAVIANNTKEATLRLKSYGDRYYLFFAALNVEVTEQQKAITSLNTAKESIISTTEIVATEIKLSKKELRKIAKQEEKLAQNTTSVTPIAQNNIPTIEVKIEEEPTEIKYINIDGFPAGYYIIANVFEKSRNLNNFLADLKNKGINANSFFDPNNKYNYVYLTKTSQKEEALNLYSTKINNTYQDRIWILSINNSNTNLTANDD